MSRIRYIPITDIINGKILLKGYIREIETREEVILTIPVKFSDYEQVEKFIKEYDAYEILMSEE